MKPARLLFLTILLCCLAPSPLMAQAASFSYQGQLRQAGQPFTGMSDLEFRLYDQLNAGAQIGSVQSLPNWPIEDGLFQVELDFGAGAFDGSDRFLEVTVDGAPLNPRQKITATPIALLAAGLASGSVGGGTVDATEIQLRVTGACPADQFVQVVNQDGSVVCGSSTDSGGTVTQIDTGIGLTGGPITETGTISIAPGGIGLAEIDTSQVQQRVTGICPAGTYMNQVSELGDVGCVVDETGPPGWNLSGNTGTNAASNFIGTIDATALEFRTANVRSLRIEPSAVTFEGSPITVNTIGGSSANQVLTAVYGATISGGGAPLDYSDPDSFFEENPNRVLDNYGAVGGGSGNIAGSTTNGDQGTHSTVSGGRDNTASDSASSVGGGFRNVASRATSTVSGGDQNTASGLGSTVSGGTTNTASGIRATVGGGVDNIAEGSSATVSGGQQNSASGIRTTISGGWSNTAGGLGAAIGGGISNTASADDSTIAGGNDNAANNVAAVIGGGVNNTANGEHSAVSGGLGNTATQTASVVGGGAGNTADGASSTIAGGEFNRTLSTTATVGGGASNWATGFDSTVAGGSGNRAHGTAAVVSGGSSNYATETASVVIGGDNNYANGLGSVVSGGVDNCAGGELSWTGGLRAKVRLGFDSPPAGSGCDGVPTSGDAEGDEGTFIWADTTPEDWVSSGPNQFLVRATGGIGFGRTPDDFFEIDTPFDQIPGDGSGEQGALRVRLNGSTRLRLLANGGLAIGSSYRVSGVPERGLRVAGRVRLGSLGTAGSTSLCRNADGEIATCSSSARYKHDIDELDLGLDTLLALRPVSYRWNADDLADIGFVAEEVAAVDERLITRNVNGEIEGVRYDRISAILANAVQGLHQRDTENQAAIHRLTSQNQTLLTRLAQLEAKQTTEIGALRNELALLRERVQPTNRSIALVHRSRSKEQGALQ